MTGVEGCCMGCISLNVLRCSKIFSFERRNSFPSLTAEHRLPSGPRVQDRPPAIISGNERFCGRAFCLQPPFRNLMRRLLDRARASMRSVGDSITRSNATRASPPCPSLAHPPSRRHQLPRRHPQLVGRRTSNHRPRNDLGFDRSLLTGCHNECDSSTPPAFTH